MKTHHFHEQAAKDMPLWSPLMPLIESLGFDTKEDNPFSFIHPAGHELWFHRGGLRVWSNYPNGKCYILPDGAPTQVAKLAVRCVVDAAMVGEKL